MNACLPREPRNAANFDKDGLSISARSVPSTSRVMNHRG
jgi:hypothetical protein